eukprot:g7113.t1
MTVSHLHSRLGCLVRLPSNCPKGSRQGICLVRPYRYWKRKFFNRVTFQVRVIAFLLWRTSVALSSTLFVSTLACVYVSSTRKTR